MSHGKGTLELSLLAVNPSVVLLKVVEAALLITILGICDFGLLVFLVQAGILFPKSILSGMVSDN